eukprot:6490261-Amphidinium_carterae.2
MVYGAALAGECRMSAVKPKLANRDLRKKETPRDHCIALDQSLRASVAWCLSALRPSRSPAPLRPNQQRFGVELEDLPEEIRVASAERHRRACIMDTESEEKQSTMASLKRWPWAS